MSTASLKRLTEARAKIELRQVGTQSDALEIVRLFQETIYELGNVSREPKHKPVIRPLSAAKQQTQFIDQLLALNKESFSMGEMRQIQADLGLNIRDFSMFIEKCNQASLLLKQPGGRYKLA